jgi:hypothetical protein
MRDAKDPPQLWTPRWSYYRLDARGRFIRQLWTGPIVIAIVFASIYFMNGRLRASHMNLPDSIAFIAGGVFAALWLRYLIPAYLKWKRAG